MAARVLFFGATADIAGARLIKVEPEANTTAESLIETLVQQYPALGSHKLNISINQAYATADDPVCDGDEVAIFTAVSGG